MPSPLQLRIVLLFAIFLALLGVTNAHAQTTRLDPGYKGGYALKNSAGTAYTCGDHWSGGGDSYGRMYFGCRDLIHIVDATGKLLRRLNPAEGPVGRRDVAPTPDGKTVYYTVGLRQDSGVTAPQGSVHRMIKYYNAETSRWKWKRDTTFSVGPFKLFGGATAWSGRYLSVDSAGNLYVTVNSFVFIFDKSGRTLADEYGQYDASGNKIGQPIGDYNSDPASGKPAFDVVEGIAVNRSGTRLWAVDQRHWFVARFDRRADGSWAYAKKVGTPDIQSADCVDDNFASPYDVGIDANENVYVADTTCGRIRRFDRELAPTGTILQISACNLCFKPHGIVVGSRGDFILPYMERQRYDKL